MGVRVSVLGGYALCPAQPPEPKQGAYALGE